MSEPPTPERIVAAIESWQADPYVHPLTCGWDSQNHRPLRPRRDGDQVVLVCEDCDYVQRWVPAVVLGRTGA